MATFVVWVDHEHSRVFHAEGEKLEKKVIGERHADHHTHRVDQVDRDRNARKMFKDLGRRNGKRGARPGRRPRIGKTPVHQLPCRTSSKDF